MSEYVTCPFCGETDFDLLGLKIHYERGWCDVYEQTQDPRCAPTEEGKTDEAK